MGKIISGKPGRACIKSILGVSRIGGISYENSGCDVGGGLRGIYAAGVFDRV